MRVVLVVAAWNPWQGRPAGIQAHPAGGWCLSLQSGQLVAGVLRPVAKGWTGQPCSAHQRATAWGATVRSVAGARVTSGPGTRLSFGEGLVLRSLPGRTGGAGACWSEGPKGL